MLNDFKINCYHVNYKNIILFFLGNHATHNFTIRIDEHNYYVL